MHLLIKLKKSWTIYKKNGPKIIQHKMHRVIPKATSSHKLMTKLSHHKVSQSTKADTQKPHRTNGGKHPKSRQSSPNDQNRHITPHRNTTNAKYRSRSSDIHDGPMAVHPLQFAPSDYILDSDRQLHSPTPNVRFFVTLMFCTRQNQRGLLRIVNCAHVFQA